MIYVGIDSSLSSPGITIHDGQKYHFYFQQQRKREEGILVERENYNITCYDIGDWKTREERIEKLTDNMLSLFEFHSVDESSRIGIEGYAFSAHSRSVTNLAELGGVIRNKIFTNGWKYEEITPSSIKKYFSGKGNSNKNIMYHSYKSYITEWNMPDFYYELDFPEGQYDNVPSPISDLVDSFAIVCQMRNKKVETKESKVQEILKGIKK